MTTVAFTDNIHVRTTAYGTNGSFCSKEYDGNIFSIHKLLLEIMKKSGGRKELVASLPMSNVLSVSNIKNCFVWWQPVQNQRKSGAATPKKFLIIDVPENKGVKSDSIADRNFGNIDQYMAIEIVVDNITDFRYIVFRKSDFNKRVFFENEFGVPVLSLIDQKQGGNIMIPSKRIVDIVEASAVHDGDGGDYITTFSPLLKIV